MPKYVVKPEKHDYPAQVAGEAKKKKSYPSVTIPCSKEVLDALEIGGSVKVELTGKVVGLESRQSTEPGSYNNKDEIRVELRVVEAYGTEGDEDEEDPPEPTMKDMIDKGLGYSK